MHNPAMREANQTYWFPAKRYGWGWGLPIRWQGWVVFAVYFGLVFFGLHLLRKNGHVELFVIYMTVISLALVGVYWLKGEKLGWRWGGK